MKPEDGKYTRKGEKDGPKLTFGERALNWAKAAAVVVPLLGIGAVADEPVKRWIGLSQPDNRTEIGHQEFEDQVRQFSDETVRELDIIKREIEQLKRASKSDDGNLQSQIDKLRGWHE